MRGKMKDEYIIINKTAIQKRIEELEKEIKFLTVKDAYGDIGKLSAYKQILSQSTPLIPETEKTFIAGATSKYVEKEKLKFAIDQLKVHIEHPTKPGYKRHDVLAKIKDLEQQLKKLQNE